MNVHLNEFELNGFEMNFEFEWCSIEFEFELEY